MSEVSTGIKVSANYRREKNPIFLIFLLLTLNVPAGPLRPFEVLDIKHQHVRCGTLQWLVDLFNEKLVNTGLQK